MAGLPWLAMPYPLDEYLDSLPGDYGKILRRTLRAARRERGTIDGIELDAGEALIDERSEKLWGGLALDRDVSPAGRRALVRRAFERAERDGFIARRAAQARGPKNGPRNGPRNGPTPTVVRFLKFRDILWREPTETAQETAQGSAQETAPASGPVLPEELPDPPLQQPREGARDEAEELPPAPAFRWPRARSFRQALTDAMARTVLYPVGGDEPSTWTSLEAALEVISEAEAVEFCRERILRAQAAGKRAGGNLAYFAQVLADEAMRRRRFAPKREPARPPPGPPAWVDLLSYAAADPQREGLLTALQKCTPRDVGGELLIVPPDPYVRDYLVDFWRVTDHPRVAIDEPLARAAGGAA